VSEATLHMLCGKIAAGKSTLTLKLAAGAHTVLIQEDAWMAHLFKPEMHTVADYIKYSARLRAAIGPHVGALLRSGMSVVLDFPANTLRTRQWMREIFESARANHQLHFLDVPDAVCMARLRARNASGEHEFAASDAEFQEITRWFVPPGEAEGFSVIRY
jgi:predicted kinase